MGLRDGGDKPTTFLRILILCYFDLQKKNKKNFNSDDRF